MSGEKQTGDASFSDEGNIGSIDPTQTKQNKSKKPLAVVAALTAGITAVGITVASCSGEKDVDQGVNSSSGCVVTRHPAFVGDLPNTNAQVEVFKNWDHACVRVRTEFGDTWNIPRYMGVFFTGEVVSKDDGEYGQYAGSLILPEDKCVHVSAVADAVDSNGKPQNLSPESSPRMEFDLCYPKFVDDKRYVEHEAAITNVVTIS